MNSIEKIARMEVKYKTILIRRGILLEKNELNRMGMIEELEKEVKERGLPMVRYF